MMQTLEATQKAVIALSFPKVAANQNSTGEGFGSIMEGHAHGINESMSGRQVLDKGQKSQAKEAMAVK